MGARKVVPGVTAALASLAVLVTPMSAQADTGSKIIERAQSWTQAGVGYQTGGTFTNQYGTYRTDCSGFVSMALGLPTSYTTGTLESVSYAIAKDALEPGDILNNPAEGPSGHVALFAGWADEAQTRYYAYEESPSGGAHVSEVPYPYWPGYGTFTPRRYVGTVSVSAPPIDIPKRPAPETPTPRPTGPKPLRDGDFVRNAGLVYRIAGGAPVQVTSWKNLGGRERARKLSDSEFAELAALPEDGTVLRTPHPPLGRAETYVVAGGAPVFVPDAATKDAVTVDQAAVDEAGEGGPLNHLNNQPADGTVVRTDSGDYYVFAGGAPIYITPDFWKTMRPRPSATTVSEVAIDQAGGLNAWSHVRYFPADGTLVKVGATVYRIEGGVPVQDFGVRGVPIDPAALDHAGEAGPWTHLVAGG